MALLANSERLPPILCNAMQRPLGNPRVNYLSFIYLSSSRWPGIRTTFSVTNLYVKHLCPWRTRSAKRRAAGSDIAQINADFRLARVGASTKSAFAPLSSTADIKRALIRRRPDLGRADRKVGNRCDDGEDTIRRRCGAIDVRRADRHRGGKKVLKLGGSLGSGASSTVTNNLRQRSKRLGALPRGLFVLRFATSGRPSASTSRWEFGAASLGR
jgi:hypothetical protein